MTVIELIKKLAEFPPDLEVVVSKDPEGNAYLPLSESMWTCYATEGEPTRHGAELEVVPEDDWEDFAYNHCDDEEEPFPGDNALVIGP
jgi:hypothetical protein